MQAPGRREAQHNSSSSSTHLFTLAILLCRCRKGGLPLALLRLPPLRRAKRKSDTAERRRGLLLLLLLLGRLARPKAAGPWRRRLLAKAETAWGWRLLRSLYAKAKAARCGCRCLRSLLTKS